MMINRKDTPAPSMQRAEPPAPFSQGPAAQSSINNSAPPTPQTPRNTYKIKTKRASKVHRTIPHETQSEINNDARAPADGNIPGERISHDLSLTDNGRHSVVDNMLMSLNPDRSNRPTFSSGSDSIATPTSAYRHLHSSSLNSNSSLHSDDTSNRAPRGRRSNSSTNYQTALSRINSIHLDGDTADCTHASIYRLQQAGIGGAGRVRGGQKSSKSSGNSSVDLGRVVGQSQYSPSHKRRSASFDEGGRIRAGHSASSRVAPRPLPINVPQPLMYDDLEAAPTPTVPGGPRKLRSTAFPPSSIHTISAAPSSQRRNSVKPSYTQKKQKGELGWSYESPMPQQPKSKSSRRNSRQVVVQPMPTFLLSRNPSPQRLYSDSVIPHKLETSAAPKDSTKERPGFFRRVFGSSKSSPLLQSDSHMPQLPPLRTTSNTRSTSREGFTTSYKMTKPISLEDPLRTNPEAVQPPLIKKPSSFFRRRKKSVSENTPPSALPLYAQANQLVSSESQRSPASSLRQVMNPYLDDPMRSNARQFAGTLDYNNTSLQTNTFQSESAADRNLANTKQDAGFNNPLRLPRDVPSSKRERPAEKSFLKVNDRPSSRPHDNSFFRDDSSNDTSISGAAGGKDVESARLKLAPTSAPVEMKAYSENTKPASRGGTGLPTQALIDLPTNRTVLSPSSDNVSSLPHPSNATLDKAEAREWLTQRQMPSKPKELSSMTSPSEVDQAWLQPGRPDEAARDRDMAFPADVSEVSPVSDYHSANSSLGPLPTNARNDIHFPEPTAEDTAHKLSVEADPTLPSAVECAQAKQVFDEDESLVTKSLAAAWLGEPIPERGRIRQAYMELFDWQNLNILAALRDLCSRLYLKGEAQQVDRILDAFSTRWFACNPSNGFKATGQWNSSSSMTSLMEIYRCCTHHLLLCLAPEYRPSSS